MLPALPERQPAQLQPGVDARDFAELDPLLPALVRKSGTSSWFAPHSDGELAALDIFNEGDNIHSFYHVPDLSALVAVAASLSMGTAKPFTRPSYFFVLSAEIVDRFGLLVSILHEGSCKEIGTLHRHVRVLEGVRCAVFDDVKRLKHYNFRVDQASMRSMMELLKAQGCLDYTNGPCPC